VPLRDEAPIGAPCWVDIMTTDTAKTQAFYTELFGWTVDDPGPDYGGYTNFHKDGHPVAGCMGHTGEGPANIWSIYLATDDAEKTCEAATAHGGMVMFPPMDVMALGKMSMVLDPGGAAIGLWQPGEFNGFGVLAEPNTPAWFELHTREYAKAVQFYRDVFKWDTHVTGDSDEFRDTTLGEGEGQLAGIMDASIFPADAPLGWSVYFAVDDTDAALAKIAKLGGATVIPAEDTPYGRLAAATDATGSLFKLVANTGS